MAVEVAKVMDGLYSHLTADSSFNTAIGGDSSTAGRLRHMNAREDETLPYVVMTMISHVKSDAFDAAGYRIRIQFDIYEEKESGPRACMDIFDALVARLHRTKFTVSSHDQMQAQFDSMQAPFPAGDAYRLIADFLLEGFDS